MHGHKLKQHNTTRQLSHIDEPIFPSWASRRKGKGQEHLPLPLPFLGSSTPWPRPANLRLCVTCVTLVGHLLHTCWLLVSHFVDTSWTRIGHGHFLNMQLLRILFGLPKAPCLGTCSTLVGQFRGSLVKSTDITNSQGNQKNHPNPKSR